MFSLEYGMRITINSDDDFLISDELGDMPGDSELGLYCADTRFLSRYIFTLNGQSPLVLAAHATAPHTAAHFLTNPLLAHVARGQLGIVRRRTVNGGLDETIEITNYGTTEAIFTVELRVEVDFCHLFDAKYDVQISAEELRKRGTHGFRALEDGRSFHFTFADASRSRELTLELSATPRVNGDRYSFDVTLAPHEQWRLQAQFYANTGTRSGVGAVQQTDAHDARGERHRRYREQLISEAPVLETDSLILQRAYEQSIHDFAALQIALKHHIDDGRKASDQDEFIIAAGIPWFMTLFGRDSLITAYQALVFFPEAARGTLRTLARLQGTRMDPVRGEEPGKILHEYRSPTFTGTENSAATFPYYGTIDATLLFLILLDAICTVTGDYTIARELREPALRALDWMEHYGDRDGDGYIEYIREAGVGLENQGWKDSSDAVRYRDGRLAHPPIALSEVQGYAYAARVGMARVFDQLGEHGRADALRQRAETLRERFERDFWLVERDYYAFALDGHKHTVDAITSNPGHTLWSGIVSPERANSVARRLVSPELFSGWGVRTLATTEGGYNPVSYHNGSVWPHDNSLIVSGLARYGHLDTAARISGGLLAALAYARDFRLPELFAGYGQNEAPFPVEYPTASCPQAWAAGSVLLLLATMTSLDPGARAGLSAPFLPDGVQRIALRGVWREGRRINIEVRRSGSEILTREWE